MTHPIVLHHFDASPFSEKIRLILGLKDLAWKSCRISRIMPRPDLMPLTGGYRRTPVMQIGADVFCDTQIIMREIERRFPAPSLLPSGNGGLPWALAMWSDRVFFQNTVTLVFGLLGPRVPPEFIEDRTRLRGAPFDLAKMAAARPQMLDQFRAHAGWIEAQIADGRDWLMGDFSLADVHAYMNVWYARSSLPEADFASSGLDRIFAALPRLLAWEARARAVGHGRREEISTADALEIARRATPQTPPREDPDDPNGRKAGDRVAIAPDDYGRVEVVGEIVSLSAQHVAIRRHDGRAGGRDRHAFPPRRVSVDFLLKPGGGA